MTAPTKAERERLRVLLAAATPGPWGTDDGNIFSRPLSDEREAVIMRRMAGEDVAHPDEDLDEPLGFVAKCPQTCPNFDADEAIIAAAVNALPGLLDALDRAEETIALLNERVIAEGAAVMAETDRHAETTGKLATAEAERLTLARALLERQIRPPRQVSPEVVTEAYATARRIVEEANNEQ